MYTEVQNKSCERYLTPSFDYVSKAKLGKYFAIWGCHQMSESQYDRGLWVLRATPNENNMTVENVREVISEALVDMKLEDQRDIWDSMIMNENNFTSQEELNCSVDRFYNRCYDENWKGFVEDEQMKIELKFVLFGIVIVVFIIFIIIFVRLMYSSHWSL